MKKILCVITLIGLFCSSIFSKPAYVPDEGMWLPMFISRLNYVDMQKNGLKLTPEEIYSVNNSSLKDAVVIFGKGCTGEIISSEGLLLTNHHCGYGSIQALSSVEHDYLRDGYWAYTKEMELPNENLTVRFLVRMEDVTQVVLSALNPSMKEVMRNKKIKEISDSLIKSASENNKYLVDVKPFYEGNEFYMFVYEEYKDVRFVGAPPSSIGKFGGETDNWMWPRHTCDFSLFRVYMSKDGKPAKYSKENVPYKPKKSLPISIKGVKDQDFMMIMGYPGRTQRYLTSYGVDIALNQADPAIVKVRTVKLRLMKEDMNASQEIRIKYASKYAASSNYWKYYQGQIRGLKRLDVIDKKRNTEAEFQNWANSNPELSSKYGLILSDIAEAYKQISKYILATAYFNEAINGTEIIPFTMKFDNLLILLKKDTLDKQKIDELIKTVKPTIDLYFKDYNLPTDKKITVAMLKLYYENVPKDQQPAIFQLIESKYKGDFNKYIEFVFAKSIFPCKNKVEAFLADPKAKILEKDPAFILMKFFVDNHRKIMGELAGSYEKLNIGNRQFVAGLREMYPNRKFYPNANSTMRLTYGKVKDYYPADAIHYNYFTTLDGIMEKEDTSNSEFIVPEKLKQLYKTKDYGRYGENGVMKVAFIGNTDITGGNSGSPVINGEGQLVGLAFDGNWEAMSGDIAFEPELQRTINVDIRYVLFIVDKFAGATNLIKELNIVE